MNDTNAQDAVVAALSGMFGAVLMCCLFILTAFYVWRLTEEALEARVHRKVLREGLALLPALTDRPADD